MIIWCVIASCLSWSLVSSQCVPTIGLTPGPNDPQLPVALPDTFQTRLEANIQDKQYGMTVEEYFDNDQNMATLKIIRDASVTTLIFDYDLDQIYYVEDLKCQIKNLTTDPNSILFGDVKINGLPHVYSTNQALHFSAKNGQTYKGQPNVRGIRTDHWSTCLHWAELNSTFTLDYFFTAISWDDPVRFPQIPVRAIAAGTKILPNGTAYQFSHTYDYFDFRVEIEDDTVFQTPPGVICPGRTSTRKIPSLPNKYHYRQEIVTPELNSIVTADVWYDQENHLFRYDYRNLSPGPPTYSMNPLTEVHDFVTGLRYIRDQLTGNCSIIPLSNSSADVIRTQTFTSGNQSGNYVLHMKNPLQFFHIDDSFTFVGQRKARGALCDVYSGFRDDYIFGGKKTSATFEYYFLSQYFTEYPDDGDTAPSDIPYMLLVNVYMTGDILPTSTVTYNFYDFDDGHPDLSLFDVSPCYSNAADLQFKVRFPGIYDPDTEDLMILKSRMTFADIMNVSNIRIQRVRLDYDSTNVYITASILDRAPPTAQFTKLSNKIIEKHDDLMYGFAYLKDCAKYCVENTDFVCNSFDFCPQDQDGNCRLSKSHVADGTAVLVNSTCDHYSRTVNGPVVQEISVYEAYSKLRDAVYNGKMTILMFEDNGITVDYRAVYVEITFGVLDSNPFPSLEGQFSYHLEVGMPSIESAYFSHIFYDHDYKLVRYDMDTGLRDAPPFYDSNPMTFIHDFNTGLAYNIDNTLGNCTITSLINTTFDASLNMQDYLKNGAYVLQMKNPIDFFSLDEGFTFVGQKTIRGQLCDVFEGTTTKFHFQGLNRTITSEIEFYSLTDGWITIPTKGTATNMPQPIRMDVSAQEIGLFLIYNFYDFNIAKPDLSNFDISPCFTGAAKKTFLIGFSGQAHPTLDSNEVYFIKRVQILLGQATLASPIRFQNLHISISKAGDREYFIGTVVDTAPKIDDFTMTSGKANPHQSDKKYPKVTSAATCASLCRAESTFSCESFDFCPGTSYCLLSREHVDDGPLLTQSTTCDHFSRTVNSTDPIQPTIDALMMKLKNDIYSGLFKFSIKNVQYNATFIVDNLYSDGFREPTSGQILNHYTRTSKTILPTTVVDRQLVKLSVDECGNECLEELAFDCQGFDYCYDTGNCFLTSTHPDAMNVTAEPNNYCDLYSRNYTDTYTMSPGVVVSDTADHEIHGIATDNLCAKQCSLYSNFTCRSFQFCNSTKTCQLFKKHTLNIPTKAMVEVAICKFYTRSFLKDFQRNRRSTISTGLGLQFTNVSADDCAGYCVNDLSNNCKSFTYCANTTVCSLYSSHPQQAGVAVTKTYCDLYSRQYFPDGSVYNPNTAQHQTGTNNQSSPSGYSSGVMAAVAIVLLLVGIALGAGLLFLFEKRRKAQEVEHMDMTPLEHDDALSS